MLQLLMKAPRTLEVLDVDEPSPGPGEVRIRVRRIGICGSDVHVWHGTHPFTPYPVVQGHEFCGHVDAVGPGVEGIAVGQLVTAMPQIVCGTCHACRSGRKNICENLRVRGFQANGCGQELFVTDAERIIPLPSHFSLEQGAFMEPVAVAAHAVGRLGAIAGENVVVMGAGTIGNLIAQVALASGANVLLTDIHESRLARARSCGIVHAASMRRTTLKEAAGAAFGEDGFSLAVEVTGAPASIDALIPTIHKGGTILVVGVFGKPPQVDLARVCEHELTLQGSMMYWRDDWMKARDLLAGKVRIEPLIDGVFPSTGWVEAYRKIDAHPQEVLKLMVDMGPRQ